MYTIHIHSDQLMNVVYGYVPIQCCDFVYYIFSIALDILGSVKIMTYTGS